MADPKPTRPERESPERLRECLEALAKHSGNDVLRVELAFGQRGGLKLLITSSSLVSEETIAARVVSELRPYFEALTKGGPKHA